ncbi:hypothetical protein VRC24_01335 [Pseudomonas poae]|uniref:hypothetical protein n=1 Tax=Pseudomonas poae TaxID=200451 RepID=UPI0030CA8276
MPAPYLKAPQCGALWFLGFGNSSTVDIPFSSKRPHPEIKYPTLGANNPSSFTPTCTTSAEMSKAVIDGVMKELQSRSHIKH